ncbi:MAG: molybdopterin-guanine dinucleotide biosynthesis protein B [Nitrospinae bacterium]|nr:molybdopterin-guanine dinucleotide biosynthesis protein B [Nitrospinota bacterium]
MNNLPTIGFCGHSGSGKTTMFEKLVPLLSARGLRVGYLKHDAHRLDVDREGKDTQRLFNAGANSVAATSPDETFVRLAVTDVEHAPWVFSECDVVIAEGYKNGPWEKIWVHPYSGGRDLPPGGLLIGGKSTRMGTPKSLLPFGANSLSEKQHSLLGAVCDKVYLLGSGPLPQTLSTADRLSDAPGFTGPLAALMSAHRHAPDADWLFLAVDLPGMDAEYLTRLKNVRSPGARFIGARDPWDGALEPLASLYASQLLSAMAGRHDGETSINKVLNSLGAEGSAELFDAERLKNANIPQDLVMLQNMAHR